jgi:hypothetical protein
MCWRFQAGLEQPVREPERQDVAVFLRQQPGRVQVEQPRQQLALG